MTDLSFEKNTYAGTGPQNYERYFVPAIGAPLAARLVEAAAPAEGQRVLDVACGTGVVARLVANAVGDSGTVAGLDLNPGMLAVAREVTPKELGIDWYETSAEATPLPDDAFDLILCQMGLQFMSNKLGALREMRRLLAPGGRAVFNVPGPTPTAFALFADALAAHIDPKATKFVDVVFSLNDEAELRELMTGAGFDDVHIVATNQTLAMPAPRDFLWQYVHSTPLAGAVSKASDAARKALEDQVCAAWRDLMIDDKFAIDVRVTTVFGR